MKKNEKNSFSGKSKRENNFLDENAKIKCIEKERSKKKEKLPRQIIERTESLIARNREVRKSLFSTKTICTFV